LVYGASSIDSSNAKKVENARKPSIKTVAKGPAEEPAGISGQNELNIVRNPSNVPIPQKIMAPTHNTRGKLIGCLG